MTDLVPRVMIGVICLVTSFVFVAQFVGSDDLEVVSDNNIVRITNVSDHEIQLTSISINDRKECAGLELTAGSATLKVGDQRVIWSQCRIIRATISTKNGSSTYSFNN